MPHDADLGLVAAGGEPSPGMFRLRKDPMTLTVHQFPCLSDNYGYLVRDDSTGRTACIDTPDAAAILAELDRLGWVDW